MNMQMLLPEIWFLGSVHIFPAHSCRQVAGQIAHCKIQTFWFWGGFLKVLEGLFDFGRLHVLWGRSTLESQQFPCAEIHASRSLIRVPLSSGTRLSCLLGFIAFSNIPYHSVGERPPNQHPCCHAASRRH